MGSAKSLLFTEQSLNLVKIARLMRSIARSASQATARVHLRAWRTNWEARTITTTEKIPRSPAQKVRSIWPLTLPRHVGWIGKRSRTLKNQAGTDSLNFQIIIIILNCLATLHSSYWT